MSRRGSRTFSLSIRLARSVKRMTCSPIRPPRKDVLAHGYVSQLPLREGRRVCLATRASIEAYNAPAPIRERIKLRAVLHFRQLEPYHYITYATRCLQHGARNLESATSRTEKLPFAQVFDVLRALRGRKGTSAWVCALVCGQKAIASLQEK